MLVPHNKMAIIKTMPLLNPKKRAYFVDGPYGNKEEDLNSALPEVYRARLIYKDGKKVYKHFTYRLLAEDSYEALYQYIPNKKDTNYILVREEDYDKDVKVADLSGL